MKSKMKIFGVIVLMAMIGFACNNTKKEEKQLVFSGTIKGLKNGKVEFALYDDPNFKPMIVDIKDGKFELKAKIKDAPKLATLRVKGGAIPAGTRIYVDNVNMKFEAGIKDFYLSAKAYGFKLQEDYQANIANMYKERGKTAPLYQKLRNPKLSKEEKTALMKEMQELNKEISANLKKYKEDYIKANPYSEYRALMIEFKSSGDSGEQILEKIKKLDPKLRETRIIKKLAKKAKEMCKTEISIDKLMANVENTEYKVDTKFNGKNYKNMLYLASSEKNVYALNANASVSIISESGKLIKTFNTELKSTPSAIACDKENKIYVFASLEKEIKKKFRGKERVMKDKVGVECLVYDANGKKLNRYELTEIKTATGARVVENTIIVSDFMGKQLVMFDKKTGKETAKISDMRPCCGILDFSVNDKKQILVANLGAFRVQAYDYSGKSLLQFGKRGRDINSFHGCCNPVSVAYLKSGAIVTVEKDPTRIKIYSKDGAKTISGIEELVKGCAYIPMTVDAQDNLYLASRLKGIIKCIKK